jgi:hypothetical protein
MGGDRRDAKLCSMWNPFFEKEIGFYHQEDPAEKSAILADVERLEEKIDSLARKIDLIFGDHVVINGRIYQLGELAKERTDEE